MNNSSILCALLLVCILPACSIKGLSHQSIPLEPGLRYEVRPALDALAQFKPRQVPFYYFTLDAPPHGPLGATHADANARNRLVRTTAYCHAENDHVPYGKLTAAGGHLRFGEVCSAAADWSRYPVGTKFRIASQPGVIYQVDDYGSALVGSWTIDLYRPTIGSMNAWGVRQVQIEIVEWGSFEESLRLMRNRIHYPHVRRMVGDIQRRMAQAASGTQSAPIATTTAPTAAEAPARGASA